MSISENMKLGLCILTAFSLLLGCQQDQSNKQSQGITTPPGPPSGPILLPQFDALLIHPGGPVDRFYSCSRDPAAKAAILRTAMAAAKAGDRIIVGAGLFDFGHDAGNVIFPDGVSIQGLDKLVTHLFGSVWSDNQGTQFVLQNTVVSDMTLECQTYGPNEDGRTIGFDNLPGPFNAIIRRCKIIGNSWAVYNWNNLGHHLLIEDSTVVSGRLCIAAMGSGGATSQFFDVVRCKLIGDASLSNDIGATSNINYGGVFGCMVRGGVVKLIDCEMNLTGRTTTWPSWTPRVCGVSDTFNAGPGSGTTVVVVNLQCHVNPNGAPPQNCWDFDIRSPDIIKVIVTGGRGSAPDGSFRWSP
jgi:hypothetical protein